MIRSIKKAKLIGKPNGGMDREKGPKYETNILQGIIDKQKVLADGITEKETRKDELLKTCSKDDNRKETEDKSNLQKSPGADIKKSKQISFKNVVAHPNIKVKACTYLVLPNKQSIGTEKTLRNNKLQKHKDGARISNVLEIEEDLNGLNIEQCLLKKLNETKKQDEKNQNQQKNQQTEPSDKGRSSQERKKKEIASQHIKVEKPKKPNELKKEEANRNRTRSNEMHKQTEKMKSIGRKDRKCNLSGTRAKTKEKDQAPLTDIKLSETQKFVSMNKLNPLGE